MEKIIRPLSLLDRERPFFHMSGEELCSILVQAEFMAQMASLTPEETHSKILIITSNKLQDDASAELTWRN